MIARHINGRRVVRPENEYEVPTALSIIISNPRICTALAPGATRRDSRAQGVGVGVLTNHGESDLRELGESDLPELHQYLHLWTDFG